MIANSLFIYAMHMSFQVIYLSLMPIIFSSSSYIFTYGFGGLVVSILATGTRVREFKPGRSRWIFRASKKSSVCLPSEGK
jgi:hypothetical protein